MTNFIASIIVSMLDIIGLVGYTLAALLSKRYWVALSMGLAWRLAIGLALGLKTGLAAMIGAGLATSLIFLIARMLRSRKTKA